jgi:putative ATPase
LKIADAAEIVEQYPHAKVPRHLVDTSYKKDKNTGYLYPHDFGGYVEQRYLPYEFD